MIHLIRNLLVFTITCNVALSMEDHEPKVRKKNYPSFFKAHKKKHSAIPRPLKESIQEERDYESYLAALSETQVTASEASLLQENKELNNETELQGVEKLIEHIQENERLQHVERLLQQTKRLLQQAECSHHQAARALQQQAKRLQQQAEYFQHQQAKDCQLTTSSLNLAEKEIYSLPEETNIMKKLKNYHYIDLSHNNIEKLPKAICEWSSLISLNLSHNKIKTAPWQVFTLGTQRSQSLTIIFCNNPIERIPNDFFEAMINQEKKRKGYQGISLEFDQDVIEHHILPALETQETLKKYLVESSCGKIRNGFCKIQNQKGEFLSFDSNENPMFAWIRGIS